MRREPVDVSKEKNNYRKMELKTEVLFKTVVIIHPTMPIYRWAQWALMTGGAPYSSGRDSPPRPWGRAKLEKIPPPETEKVEKT